PASFQAHLRKGRHPGRDPQARVLRKADPGAQAQGRRGREAYAASRDARRHQASAHVLIGLGSESSRTDSKTALSVAGAALAPPAFCVSEFPRCPGIPHQDTSMSLKQQLTDDMKAAMKGGEKDKLQVIRLI